MTKEKRSEWARNYYRRNRQTIINRVKAYNAVKWAGMSKDDRRKMFLERQDVWRKKHPVRWRKICRASYLRNKEKRRMDPQFQLRKKVSNALRSFCRFNCKGSALWFMKEVCGCERYDLVGRFEPKWNYEFDHIIPLSTFDLTNPEHLIRACHHTNVRYIPASENGRKGSSAPDGLDIMLLPRVDGELALKAAIRFIGDRK